MLFKILYLFTFIIENIQNICNANFALYHTYKKMKYFFK